MKNPDSQPLAPAPVPADVGVVMALSIEAGYLCDRLKRVRKYGASTHSVIEGELAGKIVAIVITGAGTAAARRGAEVLLVGHRPRWILSAGFAGGLDPSLVRNDVVIPREVIDSQGRHLTIEDAVPHIPGLKTAECRLMTVNRLIPGAAEKAELRRLHGADLIDMETSAVAFLAHERTLRFLPIRVISDEASAELPAEAAQLLAHSGSYRVGAAVRAIWRRPSALKDFWNLHTCALEAADRLAAGIERALELLPPS
jgi:adenosylhomocysteine nucleosidase